MVGEILGKNWENFSGKKKKTLVKGNYLEEVVFKN